MFRYMIAITLASCLILASGCAAKAMKEAQVPSGTQLEVELLDPVSSANSSVGDAVTARVASDVVVAGKVLINAGSTVTGTVAEARGLKAIGGRALLRVEFGSIDLPSGETPIRASYFREGKSETKKDAATIGGATAGGAILGRMLDHKHEAKGTLMGAVVGGAAGTAIAAGTKGEEIVLPSGTRLALHLQTPVVVKIEA
jgi:hypothetical protein